MVKVEGCRTCETMRCCPDHCCNWDGCICGDCDFCGGTQSFEYTQQELEDMANQVKEEERRKIEEAQREIEAKKQAEEEKKRLEEERILELERERIAKKREEEEKVKAEAKKIQDAEYQRTMAMIDETQKKNMETLNGINTTLKSLDTTLQSIKETNQAVNNFETTFGQIIGKMAENLGRHLSPPHLRAPLFGDGDSSTQPEVTDVDSVVEQMPVPSHIVVLTGEGLTSDNKLPPVKGKEGAGAFKELLDYQYFVKNAKDVWNWHYELRKIIKETTPNLAHEAIANLQVFCQQQKIKFTLVTQNIDGFHVDSYLKAASLSQEAGLHPWVDGSQKGEEAINQMEDKNTSPSKKVWSAANGELIEESKSSDTGGVIQRFGICNEVYEIHGNFNYMRCSNNCSSELSAISESSCKVDFVPQCVKCKSLARPHLRFFDEKYISNVYRRQDLMKEIQTMDCLIAIGDTIDNAISEAIVAEAIQKRILIIEAGPAPCIKTGKVKQLIGHTKEIVPNLCYSLEDMILQKKKQK